MRGRERSPRAVAHHRSAWRAGQQLRWPIPETRPASRQPRFRAFLEDDATGGAAAGRRCLRGVQVGQEVALLEDEGDRLLAKFDQFLPGQARHVLARWKLTEPALRHIEAAEGTS